MKESTRVVVALGAGLAGGVAIAASRSAWWLHLADAIAPIGVLWVNAIRMTVIPLVVSLLITGVASAADLRAIGRIGARTLLAFAFLLFGVAIVVAPLAPLVFAMLPGGARPALPARCGRSGRTTQHQRPATKLRGVAHLADSRQSRRGCGEWCDAAADSLHPATGACDREE